MAEAKPASLKLPRIFSDRMMLQRDIPVSIWGWATPLADVTVEIAGKKATAKADHHGQWRATLPASGAGGPHELIIHSGDETVRVKDVLIGEVWICSGQSNMEWTLAAIEQAAADITAANDPLLRHFNLLHLQAPAPMDDVTGQWLSAEPKTIGNCSAVAYYMARDLRKALNVPVGIIHSSWGGTQAEAWIPKQSLQAVEDFAPIVGRIFIPGISTDPKPHEDPGNEGVKRGWADANHNDSDWKFMDLPRIWESTGLNIDGSVWFRKEVDIPQAWVGKPLTLSLGALDDFDVTYVNGVEVGRTGIETMNAWAHPRVYTIPASAVKTGRNTIAVRIFDQWGSGGFAGRPEQLFIEGPGSKISLVGDWKFKVELELPPAPTSGTIPPTALFNAMIAPLVGYGIRGAAWYQGESNTDRAYQYRKLLPTLIQSWRELWKQGDFPFLIVQLANWVTNDPLFPRGAHWAELREAQAMAARNVSNAGLAVTIDIGEAEDIHPRNKWDVGHRLALAARAIAYGQPVEHRGPTFESLKINGDKAVVSLTHADGLIARGGPPQEFEIAGADRAFHRADASIDGTQIIVHSMKVSKPVAVRYAWADNPRCNLYNAAGLPAEPFRSDDWDCLTKNRS